MHQKLGGFAHHQGRQFREELRPIAEEGHRQGLQMSLRLMIVGVGMDAPQEADRPILQAMPAILLGGLLLVILPRVVMARLVMARVIMPRLVRMRGRRGFTPGGGLDPGHQGPGDDQRPQSRAGFGRHARLLPCQKASPSPG